MIIVTGATGKLGHHVITQLLDQGTPASQIVALARTPERAADLAQRGVQIRIADYDQPETLTNAFDGAQKVLLISANDVGRRTEQHTNIINALKKAKPELVVYTSLLHADTTTITLGDEHRATEKMLRESALPHTLLRNGWYIENYTDNLAPALAHGALIGCAADGKVAAAAREDFAAAAVTVLTTPGHTNKTYELAGDTAFSMQEYAHALSQLAGKTITYQDMPPETYAQTLTSFGLPQPVADMLVSADLAIKNGELNNQSGDLHRLINRPTRPLNDIIATALKNQ